MMFIRGISGKRRAGAAPVYLNVYDLTPINGYAYWLGLGVYHSGVQVHGVEYAYGAHEHPTTGIFEGEPRQCPGFRFRRSILIGRTDLGPREVRALMEELATEYTGDTYNLISKNCNHFCDDACLRLSSTPIPKWVNRLAKIGTVSVQVRVTCARSGGAAEGGGGGAGKRGEGEATEQLHQEPPLHCGGANHLLLRGHSKRSQDSSLVLLLLVVVVDDEEIARRNLLL